MLLFCLLSFAVTSLFSLFLKHSHSSFISSFLSNSLSSSFIIWLRIFVILLIQSYNHTT
uniref:Uncharacterized protein n=1 Tax=Amphimedon queenslandica TaxID=400682 RepID=A0A1X7TAL6_AMPQE